MSHESGLTPHGKVLIPHGSGLTPHEIELLSHEKKSLSTEIILHEKWFKKHESRLILQQLD
jgi:hypothetical protein